MGVAGKTSNIGAAAIAVRFSLERGLYTAVSQNPTNRGSPSRALNPAVNAA